MAAMADRRFRVALPPAGTGSFVRTCSGSPTRSVLPQTTRTSLLVTTPRGVSPAPLVALPPQAAVRKQAAPVVATPRGPTRLPTGFSTPLCPPSSSSRISASSPCQSQVYSPGVPAPESARGARPAASSTPRRDEEAEARSVRLRPGSEIVIGPLRLRVGDILGSGSYSVVWCADVLERLDEPASHGNGQATRAFTIALKDVYCRSSASKRQALLEAEVLIAIEQQTQECRTLVPAPRLPRCLGHQADACEEGGWFVRMALSRLPGEQLDKWLRREATAVEDAVFEAADSGSTAGLPSWPSIMRRGVAMAGRLLMQMGPTLERLAPLVWHRDVNSHNILVSDGCDGASLSLADAGSRASFWLCDLGLAVDSSRWISQGDGACCDKEGSGGAWRVTDIGGDCRYWPASSWMVHCYGAEYLEGQEDFCRQYQTRLDIHGLAITAVEVMCTVALAARRAGAPCPPGEEGCWNALLDAWQWYRESVSHWWEAIYSVFSIGGDFRPVHAWLVEEAVTEQVINLVGNLRQALLCCADAEEERGPDARDRVLRILAEFMDETSRLGLDEACAQLEEARWTQADLEAMRIAVDEGLQALDALRPLPPSAAPRRSQAEPPSSSELRLARAQLCREVEHLRVAKAVLNRTRRSVASDGGL